ncbi:MAG: hypothetical protein HeimC3_30110 [Candidatus Heimdallarchaeota archaeon LC_3]|nr:MAG: hypothetical protein HeimC3_30110 [Candidatus Heimdallarchaeota archaeon LC_3]
MSEKSKIRVEFFKGILLALLSLNIWLINGMFNTLGYFGRDQFRDAFSLIDTISYIGIFFWPWWFIIIFPTLYYFYSDYLKKR